MKALKQGVLLLILSCVSVRGFPYGYDQSVSEEDFQERFDGWEEQGFRLVQVTGFEDEEGITRYNTIWHKNVNGIIWNSYVGITEDELETNVVQSMDTKGLLPVFIDGFSVTDAATDKLVPRINIIFHLRDESSPTNASVNAGQDSHHYQVYFDEMVSSGFAPEIVSSYQLDGETRIASIFYSGNNDADWFSRHDMTAFQAGTEFGVATTLGFSLKFGSAGTVENGEPRFAAIYTKEGKTVLRPPIPFIDQTTLDGILPWMTNYMGYMPNVIDAYKTADGKLRWMVVLVDARLDADTIPQREPNGETFPETDCFDEIVMTFMNQFKVPGITAAVLKDGKIVYSQGYGFREVPGVDRENEGNPLKVMPHTPMRIGSASKLQTFLAVYMLIQQGALSLTDRIFGDGGLLHFMSDTPKPCCPIFDRRIEDITIEHLLSHQGGWDRDIAGGPLVNWPAIQSSLEITGRNVDRDDVIYYMLGQPLQHEPGTTCAYSNFGYTVLSRVIEVVTGKDYEEAVRELFLDDSGVSRPESYLGSSLIAEMPPQESKYYCPGCPYVDSCFDFSSHPEKVPNHCGGDPLELATGCGSWVSSAQQLVQLMAATSEPHCNGTLDSNQHSCLLWQSSIDTLTSDAGCIDVTTIPQDVMMQDDARYGHGIFVAGSGDDLFWGHEGDYLGSHSHLIRGNSTYENCVWAMISNVLPDGAMGPVMKKAVECVGGAWPPDFRVALLDPAPDTAPPSTGAPVLVRQTTDSFCIFCIHLLLSCLFSFL